MAAACSRFARTCLGLVLTLAAPAYAAGNIVVGQITPRYFDFKTIIDAPGNEIGGWRAVCIHASISNGNTGATASCKFEVGMPLPTLVQGTISLSDARGYAAGCANLAME